MKHEKHKDSMNAQEFREFLAKREAGKTSKYKGIPTETADGQKFQSHHEAKYYNRLLVLKRAGEIVDFERQVRYEIIVNGLFVCEYVLDFKVIFLDHVEHIDTKSEGTLTPIYRLKKKLMKACHDIDLIEVFPDK
jgi:hypothetical protein